MHSGKSINEKVLLDMKDEIATITLNRPEKLNALDIDVWHGIADSAEKIKKDPKIKVVGSVEILDFYDFLPRFSEP